MALVFLEDKALTPSLSIVIVQKKGNCFPEKIYERK